MHEEESLLFWATQDVPPVEEEELQSYDDFEIQNNYLFLFDT